MIDSCSTSITWNSGILPEKEFHGLLDRERERASRNQHPVSLVLVETLPVKESPERFMRMLRSMHERIRQVDAIGWFDQGRIGIILPYTTSEGAFRLVSDLSLYVKDPALPMRSQVFSFVSGEFLNNDNIKLESSGVSM
jgi:hypothetical protein